jgi:gas vesicle protein
MNFGTRWVMTNGVIFLTGLVVGVGTGFLLAPQSGARTRRQLRGLAEDLGERATEMAGDARETVERVIERGKQLVA